MSEKSIYIAAMEVESVMSIRVQAQQEKRDSSTEWFRVTGVSEWQRDCKLEKYMRKQSSAQRL